MAEIAPTDTTPENDHADLYSRIVFDMFVDQQIKTDMKNKAEAMSKGEEYVPAPNAILLF